MSDLVVPASADGLVAELGPDNLPHRGRPDSEEQAALAAGFGAALKALRYELGWSRRCLAGYSGVSLWHIRDLEAGRRRPRVATVKYLSLALDPGDPVTVAERLLALAGESVRPDTRRSIRQRRQAYTRPLRVARAMETESWRLFDPLIDDPWRPTFYADLERAKRLQTDAELIRAMTPPPPPGLFTGSDGPSPSNWRDDG